MRHPASVTAMAFGFWLFVGATAAAAQPPDGDQVQVDAFQCWRDIDSRSVRVGEPFTMMVTCVAVETDSATTVPSEVGLAPETIDLAPFEVIEGQRFADVRDGPWRFFQYQYTLRVIDEELFGQDVEIPALELQYHIERSLDGGSALPGRDLRYIVPAEPIRIVSLVPENAEDIRSLPLQSFGDADTRQFRANLAILASAAVGVVALGFLVLSGVQVARQWRGTAPRRTKLIAESVVVGRALRELTTLQRASQEQGWSEALVGRALSALRLAGAAAVSAPVAQEQVRAGHPDRDGQLLVKRGIWRPRATALSAAITPAAMADEITRLKAARPDHSMLASLADLRDALRVFTTARYSPDGSVATDQMTSELDKGIGVVRRLRFRTLAPIRRFTQLIDGTRGWWSEVWTR